MQPYMPTLTLTNLEEFCKCGNRNEWISMGGSKHAHYWGCTTCRVGTLPISTNKFDQLVEDLSTGEISDTMLQIAYRASLRQRKDLPDSIKDLLCGRGTNYAGVLYQLFKAMQETIGAMELAYRRGTDGREGQDDQDADSKEPDTGGPQHATGKGSGPPGGQDR